ncbi:2OG-Fe(II) oxygenase superfamily [seawater metagenome]|uniref:2OG-Fe(II) oxygenase superfamily n=1 Tax=seawater metagenome TaxID=1561972 RepID=A0A5E8CM20_9ZZZZ
MNENTINLKPIDLKLEEKEVISLIMEQLEKLGFLYVKNIDGYDEEEMFAACKAFHNIPEKEKKKLYWKSHNSSNSNIYRGMAPFLDNDESHKEIFDMGLPLSEISESEKKYPLYEDTPFPKGNSFYKGLELYYHEQFQNRLNLGFKIIRYIAEGMGKEKNYFDNLFSDSLSTFRTIYYKPRSQSTVKQDLLSQEELKLTTPEHTDSGFITILSTFGFPGLEILVDGKYKSIKPEKDSLLINLGTCLSKMTNNKLKATKHRVMDIGVERFSNPFFFDPNFSAKIPKDIYQPKSEKIQYGFYLIDKMKKEYGEWKNFKII